MDSYDKTEMHYFLKFADCFLASSQQNLYDIYLLLCVQY